MLTVYALYNNNHVFSGHRWCGHCKDCSNIRNSIFKIIDKISMRCILCNQNFFRPDGEVEINEDLKDFILEILCANCYTT